MAVTSVRFDFTSAEPPVARKEVVTAIDEASAAWPELPIVLIGYSFGAGIAAAIADRRIAGWYLLAPPVAMLSGTPVGTDPRPKAIVVPEFDQFSPPAAIAQITSGWEMTTVTTLPDTDHFLGAVQPIVEGALRWIDGGARAGAASSGEA